MNSSRLMPAAGGCSQHIWTLGCELVAMSSSSLLQCLLQCPAVAECDACGLACTVHEPTAGQVRSLQEGTCTHVYAIMQERQLCSSYTASWTTLHADAHISTTIYIWICADKHACSAIIATLNVCGCHCPQVCADTRRLTSLITKGKLLPQNCKGGQDRLKGVVQVWR